MARGPKKHLKRINTPRSWLLSKMGGINATRPSQGPHKLRECLPLSIIIRYTIYHVERDLIWLSLAAKSPSPSWINKQDLKSTIELEEITNSQSESWTSLLQSRQTSTTECFMMLKADSLWCQSKMLNPNSNYSKSKQKQSELTKSHILSPTMAEPLDSHTLKSNKEIQLNLIWKKE